MPYLHGGRCCVESKFSRKSLAATKLVKSVKWPMLNEAVDIDPIKHHSTRDLAGV